MGQPLPLMLSWLRSRQACAQLARPLLEGLACIRKRPHLEEACTSCCTLSSSAGPVRVSQRRFVWPYARCRSQGCCLLLTPETLESFCAAGQTTPWSDNHSARAACLTDTSETWCQLPTSSLHSTIWSSTPSTVVQKQPLCPQAAGVCQGWGRQWSLARRLCVQRRMRPCFSSNLSLRGIVHCIHSNVRYLRCPSSQVPPGSSRGTESCLRCNSRNHRRACLTHGKSHTISQ